MHKDPTVREQTPIAMLVKHTNDSFWLRDWDVSLG